MAAAVGRPDAHACEVPVAYVQLKPRAAADEAELMTFARTHIGERAAVPKAIRIIPAMQLTAVGKIFKPELKGREVKYAVSEALAGAVLAPAKVKTRTDPVYRTMVGISLGDRADLQIVEGVLGQFALRFKVTTI